MRFFTIHERPASRGSDLIAVASGFSWFAAILPLVWFLWHRLWLGLVVYFVLGSLLGLALELAGIAEPAGLAIAIAVSFLIGAMAADYRRWTYARHGWVLREVVLADNAWDAEQRYIRSRSERNQGRIAQPASAPAVHASVAPSSALPPRGGNDVFPRLV